MLNSSRSVLAVTAALTFIFVVSALSTGELDLSGLGRDVLLVAVNTLPLLAIRHNPLLVVLIFSAAYPLWISTVTKATCSNRCPR